MFARQWRLSRARDVQKVYKLGRSAGTKSFFIRTLKNRLNHPRITVIIGKKVAKKAVIRNRLKRLVRQAIRELLGSGELTELQGKDCIVTIHKDPLAPYALEPIKLEISQCFARLPSD